MTWTFYYERGPRKQVTGLTAALGAATLIGATATKYSTGTKDVMLNGLKIAQIAAEADKAFDDADTIDEDKFGGHLIVTNLAKNATYSLAADGIAGSVSAMAYASTTAVQAALDNLVDRLPSMFCPIAQSIVTNNKAGTFTFNTDDIGGTDGGADFTDATVGTWTDAAAGFDSHQVTVPSPSVEDLTSEFSITADNTITNTTTVTTGGKLVVTYLDYNG